MRFDPGVSPEDLWTAEKLYADGHITLEEKYRRQGASDPVFEVMAYEARRIEMEPFLRKVAELAEHSRQQATKEGET